MFKFKDLGSKAQKDFITSAMVTAADNIVSAENATLREIIGIIHSGKIICYSTKGRWSAHDLLAHILSITGKSDVLFTSWSMTPKPIEDVIHMVKDGRISKLDIVLDRRVRTTAPETLALADFHGVKIRFSDIHAKIMVIKGKTLSIAVVTSQNMTRNRRVEAGAIFAVPEVAQFYEDIIQKLMQDGESFEITE